MKALAGNICVKLNNGNNVNGISINQYQYLAKAW
jgi:hypothetical protein